MLELLTLLCTDLHSSASENGSCLGLGDILLFSASFYLVLLNWKTQGNNALFVCSQGRAALGCRRLRPWLRLLNLQYLRRRSLSGSPASRILPLDLLGAELSQRLRLTLRSLRPSYREERGERNLTVSASSLTPGSSSRGGRPVSNLNAHCSPTEGQLPMSAERAWSAVTKAVFWIAMDDLIALSIVR
jgi:hypothetical protein